MLKITWFIAAVTLVLILKLHLLPALLAGLLVHQLVQLIIPSLQNHISDTRVRLVAVGILAIIVVGATAAAIVFTLTFFRSDAGSLASLFGKMAQIIEDARASLPNWLLDYVPQTTDNAAFDLQTATVSWLRQHATELSAIGREAGLTLAHILIGMIIGAMVVTRESVAQHSPVPLYAALLARVQGIANAFQRVVFAQVKISLINSILTGIYLAIALPLFGVHLPFTKTLIIITFFAGLLPVLGNLISNTVIIVVSLAHSPHAAMASLAFLVVVHKFEYFLNARIVGNQIKAAAWELLTAMLIMESLFGLAGVIAAPIIYAWAKDELNNAGLI